jgi:hypothetical protein
VARETVAQVLAALEQRYPGLCGYLCDDTGALRKHVSVFLDEEQVRDRTALTDVPYFGFPVAVSDTEPGTAWVVSATTDEQRMAVDSRMRVCRTTDGGETWHEQTDGLPQVRWYDLVFRHALDLAGDCLAMGSTSGNLWVTEDSGEHWHALDQHLATIYSV